MLTKLVQFKDQKKVNKYKEQLELNFLQMKTLKGVKYKQYLIFWACLKYVA